MRAYSIIVSALRDAARFKADKVSPARGIPRRARPRTGGRVLLAGILAALFLSAPSVSAEPLASGPLCARPGERLENAALGTVFSGQAVEGRDRRGRPWSEELRSVQPFSGETVFTNAEGKRISGGFRIEDGTICFSYGERTDWSCKDIAPCESGEGIFVLADAETGAQTSLIATSEPIASDDAPTVAAEPARQLRFKLLAKQRIEGEVLLTLARRGEQVLFGIDGLEARHTGALPPDDDDLPREFRLTAVRGDCPDCTRPVAVEVPLSTSFAADGALSLDTPLLIELSVAALESADDIGFSAHSDHGQVFIFDTESLQSEISNVLTGVQDVDGVPSPGPASRPDVVAETTEDPGDGAAAETATAPLTQAETLVESEKVSEPLRQGQAATAQAVIEAYGGDRGAIAAVAAQRDAAFAALAAYGDDAAVATLAASGWRKIRDEWDPNILVGDTIATLFEHDNGWAMLAFRGTDGWRDNVTNAMSVVFTPTTNAQVLGARRIADAAASSHPDVVFVGHSLGGRLAQVARLRTDRPAVVFNSAPLGLNEIIRSLIDRDEVTAGLTAVRTPDDWLTTAFDGPVETIEVRSIPSLGFTGIARDLAATGYTHGIDVLAGAIETVRIADASGWIDRYLDETAATKEPPGPVAATIVVPGGAGTTCGFAIDEAQRDQLTGGLDYERIVWVGTCSSKDPALANGGGFVMMYSDDGLLRDIRSVGNGSHLELREGRLTIDPVDEFGFLPRDLCKKSIGGKEFFNVYQAADVLLLEPMDLGDTIGLRRLFEDVAAEYFAMCTLDSANFMIRIREGGEDGAVLAHAKYDVQGTAQDTSSVVLIELNNAEIRGPQLEVIKRENYRNRERDIADFHAASLAGDGVVTSVATLLAIDSGAAIRSLAAGRELSLVWRAPEFRDGKLVLVNRQAVEDAWDVFPEEIDPPADVRKERKPPVDVVCLFDPAASGDAKEGETLTVEATLVSATGSVVTFDCRAHDADQDPGSEADATAPAMVAEAEAETCAAVPTPACLLDAALDLTQGLRASQRDSAAFTIVEVMAEIGLNDRAIEIATGIQDVSTRAASIAQLAVSLDRRDILEAEGDRVYTSDVGWERNAAICSIAIAAGKLTDWREIHTMLAAASREIGQDACLIQTVWALVEDGEVDLALEASAQAAEPEMRALALKTLVSKGNAPGLVEPALAAARGLANPKSRAESLALIAKGLGDDALFAEAIYIGQGIDDPADKGWALFAVAISLAQAGRLDAALDLTTPSNHSGTAYSRSNTLHAIARAYVDAGNIRKAETLIPGMNADMDREATSEYIQIAVVAGVARAGDIPGALDKAEMISSDAGRAKALAEIARVLAKQGVTAEPAPSGASPLPIQEK